MPTKKKTSATEPKSTAAKKLGGQPESDRDAREAGVASATGTAKREPSKRSSA